MQKIILLIKKVNFKNIAIVLISLSWAFHLSVMADMKDTMHKSDKTIDYLADEVFSLNKTITEMNVQMKSSKKDGPTYTYMALDKGEYESIEYYRVNNETGVFAKREGSNLFANWKYVRD